MTEERDHTPAERRETEQPAKGKHSGRRQTIRFIVVFVVAVFLLLTGYRYAIPTEANALYLYSAARQTAFFLDLIGYSSSVENPEARRGQAEWVRAQIDAMRRGEEPEKQPPPRLDDDGEMPTPYETWLYRFLLARDDKARIANMGPLVQFVLRPGYAQRMADLQEQIEEARADERITPEAREKRVGELRGQVEELSRERSEKVRSDGNRARDRVEFRFILVPDCGAIPSMSIFIAAVLAFPTAWWRRLAGIVAGVTILFTVNTLRLACLAVIGALTNGGALFTFSHEYVWQGIYIIFVVVVWLLWVELLVKRKEA